MDLPQIRFIVLFIITFLHLIFASLFWSRGKSKETFYLGWTCFFSAVNAFSWAGVFFFEQDKLLWVKATWLSCFIMPSYTMFIYYFTNKTKYLKLKIFFWYGAACVISLVTFFSSLIIDKVSNKYPFVLPETAGSLNFLARLFVVFGLFFGLYYLIRGYRQNQGLKKLQATYFIWGLSIYMIGGLLFSGILPLFWRERFYASLDVVNYFSIIWLGLTIYAIFKKELFQIKVVVAEFLVVIIGFILFIQIFLFQEVKIKIVEFTVFVLFIFIGYLLIRATRREVKKEKEAEDLAANLSEFNKMLEKKVNKKTKELQTKIKELDESKKALMNILEDNTKASEAMEKEKNKTLAIIANFTDPIIVLDKNYRISMINPAASRVFGLSSADLDKKVVTDNKFSIANFKSVIKKDYEIKQISEDDEGQIFITEEINIKENNQESTYKVITAKVLDINNEQLGVMKIFYDLTREKAIDKMKSEFISIAAHQLRTPLSAIKWVIKMIMDGDVGKLSAEQQELLNKGYLSNERVIRLVNDLLNVSRIEEGKFGFNFESTDFKEVLDTSISNIDSLIDKSHQELKIKIPPKLPKIFLDKERVIMVIQNLLSNAIKYTPEYGKIEVVVEVDKKFINVKIKDQGVGIPAEDQPKLFSKFFRAANVVKLETEGSGLGLFMVKNIIEKHQGQVSLKSEEGKGTEVSFTLPIRKN
ncbi:MAG: ATP-binding protein [Patescibacteria group bacterium]|jgi:PAS domain S-box-containing protein